MTGPEVEVLPVFFCSAGGPGPSLHSLQRSTIPAIQAIAVTVAQSCHTSGPPRSPPRTNAPWASRRGPTSLLVAIAAGPPPRMDRSSTHAPRCTRRFEQRRMKRITQENSPRRPVLQAVAGSGAAVWGEPAAPARGGRTSGHVGARAPLNRPTRLGSKYAPRLVLPAAYLGWTFATCRRPKVRPRAGASTHAQEARGLTSAGTCSCWGLPSAGIGLQRPAGGYSKGCCA
jgi:hypothetical protein